MLALLGIAVLMSVQSWLVWYLQTYTGEKLVWDFRSRLLEHVQRLSMSFHDRQGAMESAYRIQHDASAIQYIGIQGLIPVASAVLTLAGMLFVSLRVDPALALIALAIVPPLAFLSYSCSGLVRRRSGTIKELDSSALSVIQEVLGAIRVVQAFGQERRESERFLRRSGHRMSGQVRLSIFQGLFNALTGLTIAAGSAAVLYVGVHHWRAGTLSLGSLVLVVAYIGQMYEPLRLLANRITDLESWLASMQRCMALLDEAPEITDSPNPVPLARANGEVQFRDVSFQYANGRGIQQVSFHVPAGARVGIKGTTGAGKSTLLNLLMRFYDPQQGAVLLDGVDLRDYQLADVRRQFSVVLQEPVLFGASVAENIAYGNPGAANDEIEGAARAAHCQEFILSQPNGYQTDVGERGSRLSGGERQRISLARAFLRNSSILILDEPTSSVDVRTEGAIMNTLEELMRGRTTFIIAHRLSTLESCDLILEMEQGKLLVSNEAAAEEAIQEKEVVSAGS